MQTRALKTLVRISTVGSFAQAAEQLGMTLSALSMQMKALEADLGVALFDRSVRPPRLTPLGHAVVAEARALLRREDALLDLCKPGDGLVGRFKIGFVTTAAVRLLPAFLQRARHTAPLARFDVETGLSAGLQDKVLEGRLDAAVVTNTDGLPDRLTTRLLRREPFVFAAHRHLMANGVPGLLARHRFFHFMPQTGIGKLIAQAMAGQARPPEAQTVVLDNLEAIMGCVAAGLGFTLLPVPDVDRYSTSAIEQHPPPRALERALVLALLRGGSLEGREPALSALFGLTETAPTG